MTEIKPKRIEPVGRRGILLDAKSPVTGAAKPVDGRAAAGEETLSASQTAGQMSEPLSDKSRTARQAARMLVEIEAISFNAEKPFIFTSGWASPVYTDMRKPPVTFSKTQFRSAVA